MDIEMPSMIQIGSEFAALMQLVQEVHPRAVLEIGVARGGSLARFATVAADDAIVVGVDLVCPPQVPGRPTQSIHLIQGDARSGEVRGQVVAALGGRPVDFLFIDGDHYAADRDLEEYGGLLRQGGMVAFHDIVPGPPEDVGTVPKAWEVVKAGRPHAEIVESWQQGGYGIGIIWM